MANNRRYNLGRINVDIKTPRTTQYNRKRTVERNDSSSDSSVDNQRWRENYAQVSNILHEINNISSNDESTTSQSSPVSSENESECSLSSANQVIDAFSGSTDDDGDHARNEREQLLHEQDDDYASDDDNIQYQHIYDYPFVDDNGTQNRLDEILNDIVNDEIIDSRINVNKAEIYLGVLKFSLVYNLPQVAIADLFKMLNIFCATSVLPDSKYLVNAIFNCEKNITYHALCPTCKRYVKEFRRGEEQNHNIHCVSCNCRFSLTDPTYRDFFCIMNPDEEIAYYLEENWTYYESIVEARVKNSDNINEFHSGLLYKKLRNSLPDDRKNKFITATFNSDGSPVFESSSFSIWPIQIIINELPFKVRTSKPIVCGLWFGRNKPDMNMYFEPFVNQMNAFSDEGIICNIRDTKHTIYVYAICSCDDSVARAPMQGVTQFNGYFGCNWCLHPGYYIAVGRGGSVKYILLDEPINERNEADTLRDARQAVASGQSINGVINETVLSRLNYFNIVSGFVPDPMHYLDLGIGKQFMKYWFDTKNMPYSLTNIEIDQVDNVLKAITVPSKLMRNCRSIRDRKYWKAKEYQNWILYYSTIVLIKFPRMRCYAIHWSYLVRAYYILLQNNISRNQIQEAYRLLTTFVVLTELYYSRSAMTFNIH
ncbi:uncharacterized protein LOC131667501 [Phymastichus coffea]|uniref:uncharacterized protein LOC131667501 n=1 Tax=Phymastichus coffea TaxID=108790 RepID=UPI00273C3945|nr:uncharacterized protein LOC131667501 [Phymastichus coffea]